MLTREITANASHLIIEQLVASGVKYVFNNSGSREALFFNELHSRPDIHGILETRLKSPEKPCCDEMRRRLTSGLGQV